MSILLNGWLWKAGSAERPTTDTVSVVEVCEVAGAVLVAETVSELPTWTSADAVVVATAAEEDVVEFRPTSVTVTVAVGSAAPALITPAAVVDCRPRYTFGRETVAVALVVRAASNV